MVQPGQRLPLKKYEEMGRDEKNSFCGGYIASTLFSLEIFKGGLA